MNPYLRRTLAALVLIVALIAVPYGAWFISGVTNIAREEVRTAEDRAHQAAEEASRLLASRLDWLRRLEGERLFDDYLNRYTTAAGADLPRNVAPPPLARVAPDPFILAHFMLTRNGHATVPIASDPDQRARLERSLQQAAQPLVEFLSNETPTNPEGPAKQVQLKPDAWNELLGANRQQLGITENNRVTMESGQITVTVEPFIWQTLSMDDRPMLTALRYVRTPREKWVQGFIISPQEALQWVSSMRQSSLPLNLTAGRPPDGSIAAPFMGDTWWVRVDLDAALVRVRQETQQTRRTFMLQFFTSAIAATIAGVCVIGLVFQSERLARQRSRFAASAAHELRTPLAGLRMYGEMLADGLGDPENTRGYAMRIADEANRLGRVVNNVLGFARIERGALAVRLESGDLGAAVRACVERHRLELEKAGIALDVQIDENLPRVRFDNDAVGQIMQNLLDNAEKYSRQADDRTIHVRVEATGRGVAVGVRDQGPGLDRHVLHHLFEPFTRAKRRDAPAGIGLGLTITRALVRAHRARIDVHNVEPPRSGAVISITFPA